jgi:hypothetical protein
MNFTIKFRHLRNAYIYDRVALRRKDVRIYLSIYTKTVSSFTGAECSEGV